MVVAKIIYFVAYREKPAGITFRFFSHIVGPLAGGEHFETGTKEIIDPDGAFTVPITSSRRSIPPRKVQPDLELSDGSVLVFDKPDCMVLGFDRFHLGIGPAHHFHGSDILTDKRTGYLHAMAAQVEDTAAARLFKVPEPLAVGPGVCLPRFGPEDATQGAVLYALISLQEFRSATRSSR